MRERNLESSVILCSFTRITVVDSFLKPVNSPTIDYVQYSAKHVFPPIEWNLNSTRK